MGVVWVLGYSSALQDTLLQEMQSLVHAFSLISVKSAFLRGDSYSELHSNLIFRSVSCPFREPPVLESVLFVAEIIEVDGGEVKPVASGIMACVVLPFGGFNFIDGFRWLASSLSGYSSNEMTCSL